MALMRSLGSINRKNCWLTSLTFNQQISFTDKNQKTKSLVKRWPSLKYLIKEN